MRLFCEISMRYAFPIACMFRESERASRLVVLGVRLRFFEDETQGRPSQRNSEGEEANVNLSPN